MFLGETQQDAPGQVANGADVGPFSGVSDADFRGDIPSYLADQVTLSAEVGEVLTADEVFLDWEGGYYIDATAVSNSP